jgi:hypothetical protein
MPPTACESEWGPPRDHHDFDSSNEVRVTLLVDERDIIPKLISKRGVRRATIAGTTRVP